MCRLASTDVVLVPRHLERILKRWECPTCGKPSFRGARHRSADKAEWHGRAIEREYVAVDALLADAVIERADALVPAHPIEHPRTVRLVAEALVASARKETPGA